MGVWRGFPSLVASGDTETLLGIIKEKTETGTTITSWKAYKCLEHGGFQHLTVNHLINFVDPITVALTKTIEKSWREAKVKVPRYGRRKYHLVGYLARAMFQVNIPETNKRLHEFLVAVVVSHGK